VNRHSDFSVEFPSCRYTIGGTDFSLFQGDNMIKRLMACIFLFVLAVPLVAVELKPVNIDQGFVAPGTAATFQWTVENGELASAECRILDAWGNHVKTEQATINGNRLTVNLERLVQGFWELEFPETEQRFGIVALPVFQGKPDSFFAIDAALSWLVGDDNLREGFVKAAKRSGIGMIRERLKWSGIEPKEDTWNWDADRRYEKIRKTCKDNGIDVLELFHDAPAWIGLVEKYPDDLIKTATAWETIAQRLMPTWGALEIWNEPDIGFGANLPADQYVPMVKAIVHRLKQAKMPTPIFGGVVARFEPHWQETAAQNGLLEVVDGFSFHTYSWALDMENLVARYRDWLTKYGKETMPLWLTECGRSWKKGPNRPEITEDWTSAIDITMKGVEARCCGIARYFPFVYPYYEENDNNFGMMDKFGTPTRSFAAYVQSVRMLADTVYLGDLTLDDPAILRTRAFAKGSEVVLVLYTGEIKEQKDVTLPGKILGLLRSTGEEIAASPNNTVPLTSKSMLYVRLERASIEPSLNRETAAMQLYRSSREHQVLPQIPVPVVLRYQFDKERVAAAPQGYKIRRTEEKTLPITVRVFNLQAEQATYPLRFSVGNSQCEQRSVAVPGGGFTDTVWHLPLNTAELISGDFQTVRFGVGDVENALVISFRGEATWDGIRVTVDNVTEIPVGEMNRWSKNAPNICTTMMEKPKADEQAVWRMFATFGDGDRWVYPKFEIPEPIDLSRGDGLILWARCIGDARPGLMLFERGGGYLAAPAIDNDGDWHVVKLPFERFVHVGLTQPDPNGKLDLDQVRTFSFGANCTGANCVLELKKAALYAEPR